MKKLLLVLILLSSHASALEPAQERAIKAAIRAYGYTCGLIDRAVPFSFSIGFTVSCDNYQHRYSIENRGGRAIVTVK